VSARARLKTSGQNARERARNREGPRVDTVPTVSTVSTVDPARSFRFEIARKVGQREGSATQRQQAHRVARREGKCSRVKPLAGGFLRRCLPRLLSPRALPRAIIYTDESRTLIAVMMLGEAISTQKKGRKEKKRGRKWWELRFRGRLIVNSPPPSPSCTPRSPPAPAPPGPPWRSEGGRRWRPGWLRLRSNPPRPPLPPLLLLPHWPRTRP
jgi:hypothetical protein